MPAVAQRTNIDDPFDRAHQQRRPRRRKSDPPRLYRHVRGSHYVQWQGKTVWFGTDPVAAQEAFGRWLRALPAAADRAGMANLKVPAWFERWGSGPILDDADAVPQPRPIVGKTIRQVADSLIALVDAESGEAGKSNVRWRLRPMLEFFGESKPIGAISPDDLIRYKAHVTANYKGDYIGNLLGYARRLLVHAQEISAVAKPFPLSLLKTPPKGAPKKKAVAPEKVAELIKAVAEKNRPLALMLAVQFWACLRPEAEASKVMWGIGETQSDGFTIAIASKTTRKTGELRPVVLIPAAVKAVAEFRRLLKDDERYQTGNAYRLACNWVGRTIGKDRIKELTGRAALSAHFLRHSSVQAMLDNGVGREHREVMMGRLENAVDRRYGERRDFGPTRKAAAVLSKLLPPSVVGL